MISHRVWVVLALVACQRHEDPIPTSSTTATTTTITSSSPTENVTVTPLASIAPMASATGGPVLVHAPLAKQSEAMQLQMLQALGAASTQGVLNRSDIPPVDLSPMAAGRDAGIGAPLLAGGGQAHGGGGLGGLGARDH